MFVKQRALEPTKRIGRLCVRLRKLASSIEYEGFVPLDSGGDVTTS